MKESSKAMYGTSKVKVSQEKKWMNERKKERKEGRKKERKEGEIWEKEKIWVCVKWTPLFSKVHEEIQSIKIKRSILI
jgi:hypothetical protein